MFFCCFIYVFFMGLGVFTVCCVVRALDGLKVLGLRGFRVFRAFGA